MEAHQERLLALLRAHVPLDDAERAHVDHVSNFVASTAACFDRSTLPGHVTGSAFIVDPGAGMMLLHHHRKLDRWLQMGGHDNGERDAGATALREAREESGLSRLRLDSPAVLDVDVHAIPERKTEPGHLHLDVRFLVIADAAEPLAMDAAESHDLRWFPILEAARRMNEAGGWRIHRRLVQRGWAQEA